jgi:hypothetical protein
MTLSPNVFSCREIVVSPFWKGVIWAARAAKVGYPRSVGNGNKIQFWEDQWLGNTSLSIMFWDLYYVCNQQDVQLKKCGMEMC